MWHLGPGLRNKCAPWSRCFSRHCCDITLPVIAHNGSLAGPMDYVRGWAFQQSLLERRLAAQRSRQNDVNENAFVDESDDSDRILLFEHHPVYTLGRGADLENLVFLDGESDGGAASRRRLKRTARGPDSCRLGADRLKSSAHLSLEEAVDMIGRSCSVQTEQHIFTF